VSQTPPPSASNPGSAISTLGEPNAAGRQHRRGPVRIHRPDELLPPDVHGQVGQRQDTEISDKDGGYRVT